jgi:integrase/recombinase XerD
MHPRFEQFIRERFYLSNVTPATAAWYQHSFRYLPNEAPTEEELKSVVMRMRERGLKATGCNSVIHTQGPYLKWCGSPLKIEKL